jgi:hypothetical protein
MDRTSTGAIALWHYAAAPKVEAPLRTRAVALRRTAAIAGSPLVMSPVTNGGNVGRTEGGFNAVLQHSARLDRRL